MLRHVLDSLGIDQLHTVVVPPWAVCRPWPSPQSRISLPTIGLHLLCCSCIASRDCPAITAARDHSQRPALATWSVRCRQPRPGDGHAIGTQAWHDQLSLRRGMGRTFWPRTGTGFCRTGHAFGIDFEVESYLESHADRFIGSFDANCYLYLSRAMDLLTAWTTRQSSGQLQRSSAAVCAGNRRSHRRALSVCLSNRNLPMP